MTRALIWTHGLHQFAIAATPPGTAVTFPVDTNTVIGTSRVKTVSFFTIFSFVSGVAGAGAHDADATAPTLWVNALRGGHVALGALPAAEAQAAALGVLPVAAAQHRTGCSGTIRT